MDKSMMKNISILTMITLIAGIALGITYEVTKDPIANANEQAKQAAYLDVFSEATAFEEDSSVDLDLANSFLEDNGFTSNTIDEVMMAYLEEEQLGYVITITCSNGYGGDISFSCGISLDGNINGISILSISETAGLGMKATEDDFKNQFQDAAVTLFEVVKVTPTSESEIQAISGATITSNAITGGMNACVTYFNEMLGGSSDE